MNTKRIIFMPAVAAITLLTLAGCLGGNPKPITDGGTDNETTTETIELAGTSWSGTDSVGDFTQFDFEADGSVNVTYNDQAFDEATDTWELSGSSLTVIVYLNEDLGNATYTGTVDGDTIDLDAVTDLDNQSFSVTLAKQ